MAVAMEMDQTEVRRVFEMFDRNGDGRITKEELSQSLERLGMFVPEKDLSLLLLSVDVNGDGCVDADEFAELYRSIAGHHGEAGNAADVDADMREAFKVFDANGDGFISEDELRAVLTSLGLAHGGSREECRRMIDRVDADGDGRVNFDEFCRMMKPSPSPSPSSSSATLMISSTTT